MPVSPVLTRGLGAEEPICRPRDDVFLRTGHLPATRGTGVALVRGARNGHPEILAAWTPLALSAKASPHPFHVKLGMGLSVGALGGSAL